MGKSQTKAKNKYNEKTYDRIPLVVKKGTKDIWKSEAERQGLSLNAFICSVISQRIQECERMRKLLSVTVKELDLSVPAYNCLKRTGINTIEDLKKYIDNNKTLRMIININDKRINEIIDILKEFEKNYDVSLNIDYNSLIPPQIIKIT